MENVHHCPENCNSFDIRNGRCDCVTLRGEKIKDALNAEIPSKNKRGPKWWFSAIKFILPIFAKFYNGKNEKAIRDISNEVEKL